MTDNLIAYITSTSAATATVLANVKPAGVAESWMQLAIQAGMAGVVVLLLMKFFPMMMDRMAAKDRQHEETIKHICQVHDERNRLWQEIIQSKGICCPTKQRSTKNEL
jgi:hypothetical protein